MSPVLLCGGLVVIIAIVLGTIWVLWKCVRAGGSDLN